jgi:hypothetical protein
MPSLSTCSLKQSAMGSRPLLMRLNKRYMRARSSVCTQWSTTRCKGNNTKWRQHACQLQSDVNLPAGLDNPARLKRNPKGSATACACNDMQSRTTSSSMPPAQASTSAPCRP